MIRLVLCDDHVMVRAGLVRVLSAQAGIEVAGEAGSVVELLALLSQVRADVLLLDIAMPDRDGLDGLRRVRLRWPDLPVLMLSTYPERQFATRCLAQGASGYLNKTANADTLSSAIRKLAAGGTYVSDSVAESIVGAVRKQRPDAPHEALSDREYKVFLEIARGRTPTQIATELSISPHTVSTYRSRVMRKLDTRNDVETALYAVRLGLNVEA